MIGDELLHRPQYNIWLTHHLIFTTTTSLHTGPPSTTICHNTFFSTAKGSPSRNDWEYWSQQYNSDQSHNCTQLNFPPLPATPVAYHPQKLRHCETSGTIQHCSTTLTTLKTICTGRFQRNPPASHKNGRSKAHWQSCDNLEKLPIEIRRQIYTYLLLEPKTITIKRYINHRAYEKGEVARMNHH